MSYRVLARKWRPQHFSDMLGQEPVVRALTNALDSDRLHHAYLFSGMRGVGKTTIARIFAKCLNCETSGVSSDPCGQCSACQDIESGRFLDLIEVDAASRTKVESTRELLENVPYAPASGRFKVYLIDEVHMFSTASFNALLKTLEEPPEHVKFLLATTDPQKLPATVVSRCLQFNLRKMMPGTLARYLSDVLAKENIEHEMPALDLIARASDGSVRDSLSLVEQSVAFGGGAIVVGQVEDMLGRVSVDRLISLIELLAAADMPALFTLIEEMAQYSPDFHELLGEMLSLLYRIALLQSVKDTVDDSVPGHERLVDLSISMDPDAVQLFYQIGLHARRDMPLAPDAREAFDMALLRMNAFKPQSATMPDPDTATVAAPTDPDKPEKKSGLPVLGHVSAGLAPGASRQAVDPPEHTVYSQGQIASSAASAVPAESLATQTAAPVEQSPLSANNAGELAQEAPAAIPAVTTVVPAEKPRVNNSESAGQPMVAPPADISQLSHASWPQIVESLDIAGMPLQLADNCELLELDASKVRLKLERASEHLYTPRFVERLQTALSAWAGSTINLHIDLVDDSLVTPAKLTEQKQADELAAAHASIRQDPIVQQLIERVDGAVDESSVRPIGNS